MKHLIFIAPSSGIDRLVEDFTGDEAESVLNHWTALWHPMLIDWGQTVPSCRSSLESPEQFGPAVVSVSSAVTALDEPSQRWRKAASQGQMVGLGGEQPREQLAHDALVRLGVSWPDELSPELVQDFFALGYWHLQIETLTQRMHYTSSIDESKFRGQLVAAAQAAIQGDDSTAQEKLQQCFEALAEVRDQYYPVDVFLLHIVLVTEVCTPESTQREFEWPTNANLMITTAELRERVEANCPSLDVLRANLKEQRLGLVGADDDGREFPFLDREEQLASLLSAAEYYQATLHHTPRVFGRYHLALSARMPGILRMAGYDAVLHWAMDASRFPRTAQSRFSWKGCDGNSIDALGGLPLDAASPELFLRLSTRLSKSMESDYVATICLVNWAGHGSIWLDDLRRGAKYSRALGEFTLLDDYFKRTDAFGQSEQFSHDDYAPVTNSANSSVEPSLCESVEHWKARVGKMATNHLTALANLLGTTASDEHDGLEDATRRLADSLVGDSLQSKLGTLILNPFSFPRRVNVQLDHPLALDNAVDSAVDSLYAFENSAQGASAVVDVPPAGYVWLPDASGNTSGHGASGESHGGIVRHTANTKQHLVDGLTIRNEFLELSIDPATGGIRSARDFATRGNCLSQRAYAYARLDGFSSPDDGFVARAQSVLVTRNTSLVGEITASGRFVDGDDRELARFVQTTRLWRGSRVVELVFQVDPPDGSGESATNLHVASRIAWLNPTAKLAGGDVMAKVPIPKRRPIRAPLYLEIDDAMNRIAVLAGGLERHRRVGPRMLETWLEDGHGGDGGGLPTELGIGINLKQPLHDALGRCIPVTQRSECGCPSEPSGWLFSLSSRCATVTSWQAEWEPDGDAERVVGFRLRVLESNGIGGTVRLSCFHPLSRARKIRLGGKSFDQCDIKDGVCHLRLTAHEWTEVECRW